MSLGIAALVDVFIIPGGASGLSMAVYYLVDKTVPIGIFSFIINIPLFFWGLKVLGNQFGVRTFYGFTVSSFFIDFFNGVYIKSICIANADVVKDLAANDFFFLVILGALLMGIGLGFIFRNKGTTGGSDISAAIFQKKYGISPAKSIIWVDAVVITLGGIVFAYKGIPMEKPILTYLLYSVLRLFIETFTFDTILNGFDYARMALIITDKSEEVAQNIMTKMSRGVTALKSRGVYRNVGGEILLTVVTIKEMQKLNDIVKEIDENAFMINTNIYEVFGHGFRHRI
jgi:uncharacterized membrane-anchored protein YitT (DUF2179 family)